MSNFIGTEDEFIIANLNIIAKLHQSVQISLNASVLSSHPALHIPLRHLPIGAVCDDVCW
jgi:hypothetical protein